MKKNKNISRKCTKEEFMLKRKSLVTLSMTAVLAVACVMSAGCNTKNDTALSLSDVGATTYVKSIEGSEGLELKKQQKEEITDETLDIYVDYLISNFAQPEKSDKQVVESGDIANIDFEGIRDGVAFDGGTGYGYDLEIGSGSFIPGFEDGLIGVSVGEEVAIPLKFPDDYFSTDLAGVEVTFNVKVNYISVKPDKLTDELIAGLGLEGISTADEFMTFLRQSLDEEATEAVENASREEAMTKLGADAEFSGKELPKALVEYYVREIKTQDQLAAHNSNISLDQYITSGLGIDLNDYDNHVTDEANTIVRELLICDWIAEKNNITVTDEEYTEALTKDANLAGSSSPEEYEKTIDVDIYRNSLLKKKVLDFVVSNSTFAEE